MPAPNCPEFDERLTVIVGTVDTGVPNRITGNRCTINELIEDEKDWSSHALFLKHVDKVLDKLLAAGVIDAREHKNIYRAAKQSGIGKPGQDEGYKKLFDGTAASFAKWQQVGGGRFGLNADGSITSSTTVDGMGMLWFPGRQYGDFSLKLQWRDDAPGTGNANGGVFVRFPNVHDNPEESRPEWVAIKYGHEVQILDKPDGDMYKTGSIYGFDRIGLAGAGVTPKGTWNDYEIRVVDQHYSIYRNGVLLNEFDNNGGQVFEPPRGRPGHRRPALLVRLHRTPGPQHLGRDLVPRHPDQGTVTAQGDVRWPRPHAEACGRGLPDTGGATPGTRCRRPATIRRAPGTGRPAGDLGSRRRRAGR